MAKLIPRIQAQQDYMNLVANKKTNFLDFSQAEALKMALNSDIKQCIINGQAGTGKTFTVQEITKQLEADGYKVSRVAPTGRAALKVGGSTIHSWLEPDVETMENGNCKILGFNKDFFEQREILIVDESSMIDDNLMQEIMRVYLSSPKARIIWVGDEGQLEPVGQGRPYINMINNKSIPIVTLDKIHRTSDDNDIVMYADAIRNNKQLKDEYNNVSYHGQQEAIDAVIKDMHNNQILCPMKNNFGGIKYFNKLIQPKIETGELLVKTIEWSNDARRFVGTGIEIHEGDKVVFNKNNISFHVTNGTVGIAVRTGRMKVMTTYGPKIVDSFVIKTKENVELEVPLEWASKNTDLAYAITIHKSQGSEWENVFVSVARTQTRYFDKKMHYTAVTRGKHKVGLVS